MPVERDCVMLDDVLEIAPGLWHWTARHEHIHMDVSSYYLLAERVLIDAMIPAEGLSWFDERGAPEHVLLTNRHHDRDAWRLRDAFGCAVHCVRSGLHELDAICPDETALYIPAHHALACADGVVRWPGRDELGFVPDELMDNPEETKAGLRDAYRRVLDLDFDLLLLAHGDPMVTSGKEALRAFAG